MHTRNHYLCTIILTISMILCMLPRAHSQNGGQVTVTADPEVICAGESSTLHAEYYAPEPLEPITYTFEDGMQGWTTINVDASEMAWERSNSNPHGGSYCMRAKYNYSSVNQDYLVSPQITLGVGKFSFYARRYTNSGSYQYDRFRVYLSTTGNSNVNDFNIELTNGDETPGITYEKYEYDLSSFQGQGYIAIVYTAPANQYYLYVDDVTVYDDGSSSSFDFGFEDGMQGWTTINVDASEMAWERSNSNPHGGSYCMRAKYNYSSVNQDYLVSPQITLGVGKFSFYARRYTNSGSYQYDRFRVYLSTTGNSNVNDFNIELTNGDETPGITYEKYEYDLSSFQGQGYIAIVYTAPANQYYLYVDDVSFEQHDPGGGGGGTPSEATFTWTPGNLHGPDVTVYPTETTTYTVTATDESGTIIGTANQTVVVYQDPELSISTNTGSANICEGDTIVLYVTVGGLKDVKVGDILCTDGTTVPPSQWPCEKTAKGIVFYVDATGQHGWAVDLGEITQTKQWSTASQNISGLQNHDSFMDAITDLDGYNNTQAIRSAGNASNYPAAYEVDFSNGWYLPSAGQLNILYGEYFAVNTSLELVGGLLINSQNNAFLWSSSAASSNQVWIVTVDKGYFQKEPKTSKKNIRAVIDF